MTTAQESTNGHLPQKGYPQDALFAGNKVPPPPCSLPDSQDQNPSKDSTNNNPDLAPPSPTPPTEAFPASAYHVPPSIYVPEARAYRYGEPRNSPHLPGPLPGRCQFMFSDGRQCTMARSDIHPSLCVYHSDREEQLFGSPSYRCEARTLDFPELYSVSRDLSTAAGVNRALAQVFRMLAQRRISRQEAATFAHLAKLLLRTISLMAAEAEVQPEERLPPVSPRLHEPQRHPLAYAASASDSRKTSPPSAPVDIIGVPGEPRSSVETASAASVYNPPGMNTYKNTKLQPIQNQHLQKSRNGISTSSDHVSGFPGAPSFATPTQASPGD